MAVCLGDPEYGYYRRREPFGPGGDFVTAPDISQVFGELIGLWAVAAWTGLGAPERFVLAELGPGRGTMMADALRAARVRPAFLGAAEIVLVESSPRLREVQAAALSGTGVAWRERADDLPDGPLIVLANEFFDALPVYQYVRTAGGWAERVIGLDAAGRLQFGLRPGIAPPSDGSPAAPGAVLEHRPAAEAIVEALARRIASDGGAALAIDYGHSGGFGDTLQAIRGHRYEDPLAAPGEADLTAHVDFAALARAAERGGAEAAPLLTQGAFLARLGIARRAAVLAQGKPPEIRAGIAAAVERLAGPAGMGTLFKVLGVGPRGVVLPGFDPR
jgi:NADH dehydrogenase [ubiquinone] 1 alpha subcomplex assembly factor 7